jgi:rhodanese-related sulfurtransferase
MTPSLEAILGLALLLPTAGPAVTAQLPTLTESPSHYCGIHCVYAAAQHYGVQCDFEKLADTHYVTSRTGSSAAALVQALKDLGLHGYQNDFLTVEQLSLLGKPTILHVRAPGAGLKYRHWVLFLGFDGDHVKLYDPPRDVGTVTTAELLSMWDGAGIVVDNRGSLAALPLPFPLSSIAFVIGAAVLIGVLSRWVQGWRLVVPIALAMSFIAHVCLPRGFLRAPSAVANVQRFFLPADVPIVDLDQTRRLIASGDCLFVDARLGGAFARFHLPGAVSVPVDSSYINLNYKAAAIGGRKSVIVYCQNKNCEWAEHIATQLAARGINNIRWYRGGVNEWRAMNP